MSRPHGGTVSVSDWKESLRRDAAVDAFSLQPDSHVPDVKKRTHVALLMIDFINLFDFDDAAALAPRAIRAARSTVAGDNYPDRSTTTILSG